MNLPNRLSLLRVALIPPIVMGLLAERVWFLASTGTMAVSRTTALVLILLAVLTDWYDGYLARKYQMITNLGKLLDPLADKMLVAAVFIALVELGVIPAWAVIIILSREFLVTGLRSIAAQSGRVISADNWGKHKTAWQMGLMVSATLYLAVADVLTFVSTRQDDFRMAGNFEFTSRIILDLILYVTVFLTVYSGYNYLKRNMDIIRED